MVNCWLWLVVFFLFVQIVSWYFFGRYVPSFLPPPSTKGNDYEKKVSVPFETYYHIPHLFSRSSSNLYFLLYLQREEEKPKEKGKSRNIDKFLEELKKDQEMRERRNQEHEHGRDGRHSESSSVSDFSIQWLKICSILPVCMCSLFVNISSTLFCSLLLS